MSSENIVQDYLTNYGTLLAEQNLNSTNVPSYIAFVLALQRLFLFSAANDFITILAS